MGDWFGKSKYVKEKEIIKQDKYVAFDTTVFRLLEWSSYYSYEEKKGIKWEEVKTSNRVMDTERGELWECRVPKGGYQSHYSYGENYDPYEVIWIPRTQLAFPKQGQSNG